MLWSVATVFFYAASSLGDKFIAAKLKCSAFEFSFWVGLTTAAFLSLLLPLMGWRFSFTLASGAVLVSLIGLKIVEFYTSALLLKRVSAYELKAWLSLNVPISFFADLIFGKAAWFAWILPCTAVLVVGVTLVAMGEGGGRRSGGVVFLCFLYITSKFLYGFCMNALPAGCNSVSVLILVMVGVVLLQLPFVDLFAFFRKKGLAAGALTRIPNAGGLLTEAFAASQSLLLYALVQPMQLALLFLTALVGREKTGAYKLIGTLVTLVAVCGVTVLVYFYGGKL